MTIALSFSADGLTKTVNTVLAGARDILSPVLSVYHPSSSADEQDLVDRYQTSQELRQAAGIPVVPAASFFLDSAASGASSLFRDIVVASGIEELFEEDLIFSDPVLTLPDRLGSFIVKESRRIQVDNADLVAKLSFKVRQTAAHLTEASPLTIADEDVVIHKRADNAFAYIRVLTK